MVLKPSAILAVLAFVALAACGGAQTGTALEPNAAVERVVAVLDDLGIAHSDPVRGDVGLSGAKAIFEITINGFDAGVNVFPDKKALERWQELSNRFGGVHVSFENVAISLNSSEGITNSVEIAPKIAEAIGGEAHNA